MFIDFARITERGAPEERDMLMDEAAASNTPLLRSGIL
jgi:hypothetical protein